MAYRPLLSLLFLFLISSSLSAQGIQWESNYGGTESDDCRELNKTSDGGFILCGPSYSSNLDVGGNNGARDFWINKINAQGTIQWEANYGGSSDDIARSVIQTHDSGYAIAGVSSSSDGDVGGNNGNQDFWIIRSDSSGNLLWEENYGGSSTENASSIVQASDSGFVVVGRSYSSTGDVGGNNGNADHWVIKLDPQGNLLWEENFGGSSFDVARSVVETNDGGYAVAGEARSKG
ncbi:MAG: hypothetical protein ABEH38_08865 [Flavobacteriales bacterium]